MTACGSNGAHALAPHQWMAPDIRTCEEMPPDDTKSPELMEITSVFERTFQVENQVFGTQSELPKTGSIKKVNPSRVRAMTDTVILENLEHD